MKFGIITYTHGTNWGQRLQNYALQHKLEELGHTVYTLRQTEPYSRKHIVKEKIKNIIKSFKNVFIKNNVIERERVFNKFNNQYIHFYKRKLHFLKKNKWISRKFDAFIVGSDQIWSPISNYVGDNSFLLFADLSQKLTYAPSLSVNKMPEEKVEYYKKNLSDFKYISIREYKGKEILESILDRDIEVVVDPTLLLNRNEWNKIRKKCSLKPDKKYCLGVFLGEFPKEVYNISEEKGLHLLLINDKTPISPDEFIDLVADASFVLTDSFHATIFAAIYHIDFVNFSRSDFGDVMNSRFETLYKIFDIENRIYNNSNTIKNINFKILDDSVIEYRKRSMEFLLKEIGNV